MATKRPPHQPRAVEELPPCGPSIWGEIEDAKAASKSGGVDKNQYHKDIAAKLSGIGKEAVIDVNLCDAKKILRAFEEIGNFMGSNIYGVGH